MNIFFLRFFVFTVIKIYEKKKTNDILLTFTNFRLWTDYF